MTASPQHRSGRKRVEGGEEEKIREQHPFRAYPCYTLVDVNIRVFREPRALSPACARSADVNADTPLTTMLNGGSYDVV